MLQLLLLLRLLLRLLLLLLRLLLLLLRLLLLLLLLRLRLLLHLLLLLLQLLLLLLTLLFLLLLLLLLHLLQLLQVMPMSLVRRDRIRSFRRMQRLQKRHHLVLALHRRQIHRKIPMRIFHRRICFPTRKILH